MPNVGLPIIILETNSVSEKFDKRWLGIFWHQTKQALQVSQFALIYRLNAFK
jgi:hypothetical protein